MNEIKIGDMIIPICTKNKTPGEPINVIRPFFDKKTGSICMPYEKKFILVEKDGKKIKVEFMKTFCRNRLQIRVPNIEMWNVGNTLIMNNEIRKMTFEVKSIRKNKIVIRSVDSEFIKNCSHRIKKENMYICRSKNNNCINQNDDKHICFYGLDELYKK